ncbi:uncharacterized protein LY89DRAFT_692518 [Mollisia scopiformis]|uniref:BTB domain-containing protein n=1 Tax=Mollisia scopiformis TaxID=149040 RepID=A0A132B1Y6_MOLSC|nr:uncharacterized protein LY89DRAFT_692518 [Mollisia scopiformis]KUJ06392.1 hypothetical protein LY89DRAFT_692518 [Mollisia scopiformis]
MVTINVGTETKQTFLVHNELLALYSEYFHDVFSGRIKQEVKEEVKQETKPKIKQEAKEETTRDAVRQGNAVDLVRQLGSPSPEPRSFVDLSGDPMHLDNKSIGASLRPSRPNISDEPKSYNLPNIKPSQFAQFVSYIYAGRIIDAFEPLIMATENNSVEALWYVGQTLRSPSFQNNLLEGLRTSQPVKSGDWPSVEDIEIVYDLEKKPEPGVGNGGESLFKKFSIHCLAANNPFDRYEVESSEGQGWNKLMFDKEKEVFKDFILAGNRWDTKPWEDKERGKYMVDEDSLEERWERMILARRGEGGVKKAAAAGDVGAKLEEEHLEAEKKRLGYARWGGQDFEIEIEDSDE